MPCLELYQVGNSSEIILMMRAQLDRLLIITGELDINLSASDSVYDDIIPSVEAIRRELASIERVISNV